MTSNQQLLSQSLRTDGDGMENSDEMKISSNASDSSDFAPEGRLVLSNKYTKPKFIPCEPYKGAVNLTPTTHDGSSKKYFSSKGNQTNASGSCLNCDSLLVEKTQLESQLNDQIKVNEELKKLMVASMGEDMETKMNVLTEDKLHLTQELLESAKKLSTHQEQVEWLAGQSQVWQSKFMASSVMVKELSQWKDYQTKRLQECFDTMEKLLSEEMCVRKDLLQLYENLSLLKTNFDYLTKRLPLRTSNIVDLAHGSMALSNGLVVQLLGGGVQHQTSVSNLEGLSEMTSLQLQTDALLKTRDCLPNSLDVTTEAACSAVIGAGMSLHGNPSYFACCPNCSGKVQVI